MAPIPARVMCDRGFSLIELLIVIGLLGALAAVMLTNLGVDRTETLDRSIVQKELADIQRAYQRFAADCVPSQADYKRMTRYGLEILTTYDSSRGWSFPSEWDTERGKGWRGPYIEAEGTADVDATDSNGDGIADSLGQPAGSTEISVICTPYVADEDGYEGDYYRVIPEVDAGDSITQLWVVFPSHSGQLDGEVISEIDERDPSYTTDLAAESAKRRLMLKD